jgi:hypothetical protein
MPHPSAKHLEDAVFVPRGTISAHNLIYDRTFELVEESCLRRGIAASINVSKAPQRLPRSLRSAIRPCDERLVFFGHFVEPHYGHLLTEGMSRYWYLLYEGLSGRKVPERRSPFGALETSRAVLRPQLGHWRRVVRVLGLSRSDFKLTSKPVQCSDIVVPEQSWYERWKIDPIHLAVTQRVGRKLVGPVDPEPDSTPIYLSRTKLKKANFRYLYEEGIERYCRQKGCRIVYPERLSLDEQALLFNTHDLFVGCEGSAFHSALFRFVDRPLTHIYLARQGPVPNFEIIDSAMGITARYIRCYNRTADQTTTFTCNPDEAIDALRDFI